MTWLVRLDSLGRVTSYWLWHDGYFRSGRSYWIMSNYIDYDIMDQSGHLSKIGSCQIISIMTWWISHISWVKFHHVRSYWLWRYVSVRLVRSNWIMSDHVDNDMMNQSGQLGKLYYVKSYWLQHDGSVKEIFSVKLEHFKSYLLWHDVSVR